MRTFLCLTLLLCSAPAFAQTPPKIAKARLGLPTGLAGQESGRSRNNAWAPLAITLEGGKQESPANTYRLVVEANDIEDLPYRYTVAVPGIAAGSERVVMAYAVPSSESSEFRIRLETMEGKAVQRFGPITRDAGREESIAPNDLLFLAIGGNLAQLRRAAEKLDQPKDKKQDRPEEERGKRRFAFIDQVSALPDRWFGYDAVDVIILTSGQREFINALAADSARQRRNALLEWVRRGGRLVISVGRHTREVAALLRKLPLLDVTVADSSLVESMPTLSNQWCKRGQGLPTLTGVQVASVKPGPEIDVLVREGGKPVLMQASSGLGRVLLVAFDLDSAPFITWEGQESFWMRLQNEIAPPLPPRKANTELYDLRSEMKRGLETFEEIPVVSFGWVALFLLFYIALIGPLDYFVLKKVFKRLELTWITFPVTVLVVSVAAYFTAYTVKGDEVRINKIDLIDVDMHSPRQVYGHTWLTLFSPRVSNYTLGLEPAEGTWTGRPGEDTPGPVITLLEGDDRMMRGGMQTLSPKPYRYAEDASGVSDVPVAVWATRSFTASWRAPLLAKKPILGILDSRGKPIRKRREGMGEGLIGKLTNNLPVELQDVCVFYRDRWYSMGKLAPGEERSIDTLFDQAARGQNRDLRSWFTDSTLAPGLPLAPGGGRINAAFQQGRSAYRLMKPLLFFQAAENTSMTNAGMRRFDQSWRLRSLPIYPIPRELNYRDEVIVVARAPMLSDKAETVTEHGASPSRLWLGRLPGEEEQRPRLPGYLTQETYIRVFIPVGRQEP